ncbi:uncharacterized protein METZ01_LOCUS168054 [marine metagenome]|uniref:Uncharacterized protein n=1 Tax=marine metagenome TaxID=408172 RepID=A0A382BMZ7_9ZZZZ
MSSKKNFSFDKRNETESTNYQRYLQEQG